MEIEVRWWMNTRLPVIVVRFIAVASWPVYAALGALVGVIAASQDWRHELRAIWKWTR